MNTFMAELVGTMLLVLLGDGVVAAVVLNKTKAQGSGWMVITTGWGMAVAMGVYAVGRISGAHINPAITLGLAVIGKFPWSSVPSYLAAQFLGAFLGAVVVWLAYLAHWPVTEDQGAKLAVFCTAPAVRKRHLNLLTEIIGTFVLMFGVLAIVANTAPAQSGLTPLLIGFLVWSIGLSLGAPTGYAINPARDLGPRLAHSLLPIAGKGGSDWSYSWVPVVGPVIGGLLGAVAYVRIFGS
ncbi:MAG TPA: MIP/aquaporin family protein [Terriglobia bacterium]|nr:MIP/aquaporin family protein [Terriglobia bacterium]